MGGIRGSLLIRTFEAIIFPSSVCCNIKCMACSVLSGSHGLGFYVSVLGVTCRFFLGRPPFLPLRRFAALLRWVFGPVEKPPCSLQRPPRYSTLLLQRVPLRVFAPQQLL